jgi:hypothetical protein
MNLSWVYDLNFKASFRLMKEKKHFMTIAAGRPETNEVRGALMKLYAYIESDP